MPPKKAAAANGETGEGVSASVTHLLRNMYLTTTQKFTWEGANENKLLLIILGRHIQTSEFEEVAKAFPGMSWFFHSFAHSLLTTSRCDWRRHPQPHQRPSRKAEEGLRGAWLGVAERQCHAREEGQGHTLQACC